MLEPGVRVPGVSAGRKEEDSQGELGGLVALGPHLHPALGCIKRGTPTLQRGMPCAGWGCPPVPPGVFSQDAQYKGWHNPGHLPRPLGEAPTHRAFSANPCGQE